MNGNDRLSKVFSRLGYFTGFLIVLYIVGFFFSDAPEMGPSKSSQVFLSFLIALTVSSFYLAVRPPFSPSAPLRIVMRVGCYLIAAVISLLLFGTCLGAYSDAC